MRKSTLKTRSPSYLFQSQYGYNFRLSVPSDLREVVGRTLVQLGQEVCKTPEQFKAWSQNLGHEKVLTTFLSYGEVACQRQGEIIRSLTGKKVGYLHKDAEEIAEALFKKLQASGG